jgi:hypothetical protein
MKCQHCGRESDDCPYCSEACYRASQPRNRARCRQCGDIVESTSRHDFVSCRCGAIAVDGGQDYLRRVGHPDDVEEMP